MILAIVSFKLHPLDKLIEEHLGIRQTRCRRHAMRLSMCNGHVMKRKYYDAAIRMLHLHVTTLSMDFDEVEPLECREDLLA